jgi:hypothetical protein
MVSATLRSRTLGALGEVDGLVAVLMKRRNGGSWTAEDRRFLRAGLTTAARWAPLALLLLLPGGLLMLPAWAWLLDRRRSRREPGGGAAGSGPLGNRRSSDPGTGS